MSSTDSWKGPAVGKQWQSIAEKRAKTLPKSLKIKLSITSQLCLFSLPPPCKIDFLSSLEASSTKIGNLLSNQHGISNILQKYIFWNGCGQDKGRVFGRFVFLSQGKQLGNTDHSFNSLPEFTCSRACLWPPSSCSCLRPPWDGKP